MQEFSLLPKSLKRIFKNLTHYACNSRNMTSSTKHTNGTNIMTIPFFMLPLLSQSC